MKITEQWEDIKSRLKVAESRISKREGALEELRATIDEERTNNELKADLHETAQKASMFLLQEVTERRDSAVAVIERMGTTSVQNIYGSKHALKFEGKQSDSGKYTLSLNIVSDFGEGPVVMGVEGEQGGGLQETVSFPLRGSALDWTGYDGPLILDEAFKSISDDDKIKDCAKFLKYTSDQMQRQIIFATHKADVFAEHADKIFLVEKPGNESQVSEISVNQTERTELEKDQFYGK